jgi:hypothetical protein
MVATAARILANQANSLKSTGPRSTEGRERSRGNGLKHGLCSTVVVHPDDAQAMTAHPEAAGLDGWFQGQVALTTLKIERCQAMERAARSRVVARASVTWDEDRRGDAIRLGSKLAGRPEEVVTQLRETLHGCEWLLARWAMLAHAADSQRGWTPELTRLAFDLLGTPAEFREGYAPGTEIDLAGKSFGLPPALADVARRAIDELIGRRDLLRPLDEAARERAEADLSDDDPEIRRLRRYEAELHRRLKWSLEQIRGQEEASGPAPAPEAGPESPPEPEFAPLPLPMAPPSNLPSRVERRLLKAESRREAKHRKLEHLRN